MNIKVKGAPPKKGKLFVKKKVSTGSGRGFKTPKGDKILDESPWMGKLVRVVSEEGGDLLGRCGQVTRVTEVTESGAKRQVLAITEDTDKPNLFKVDAKLCRLKDDDGKAVPAPLNIDFRHYKNASKRADLLHQLIGTESPESLEPITANQNSEHSTARAALLELELRFELKDVVLVPPSVVIALSDPDGIAKDGGCETAKYTENIKKAQAALFVIWGAHPDHYTLLVLECDPEGAEGYKVRYRDPLKVPSKDCRERASRLLSNMDLPLSAELVQQRAKIFQTDGWSCLVWVLKWIESELRSFRGEPIRKLASHGEIIARVNAFIGRLKNSTVELERSEAKAKAKAAAKAAAKAKAKPPKTPIPVHETLEEAKDAALK